MLLPFSLFLFWNAVDVEEVSWEDGTFFPFFPISPGILIENFLKGRRRESWLFFPLSRISREKGRRSKNGFFSPFPLSTRVSKTLCGRLRVKNYATLRTYFSFLFLSFEWLGFTEGRNNREERPRFFPPFLAEVKRKPAKGSEGLFFQTPAGV